MDIRAPLVDLLQQRQEPGDATPQEEMIEVSPATKRVAFAYERFRNTLEPDEEDILRRNAIYRILERRLAEGNAPVVMAEQLLQELIRANYIESVPRRLAERLGQRIIRTQQVLEPLSSELRSWFLHIVAVSIDQDLYPRVHEEALVRIMYQDTYQRVAWADDFVDEHDRPIQLYMGSHRALFEADDFEISYHYFVRHFPVWNAPEFTEHDVVQVTRELPEFHAEIEAAIHYPHRERITRLLRPVAVPYRIIRDLLPDPASFESDDTLTQATQSAISERSRRIRSRMNRRAWNSILFLFFTKTILAFLIEVPYEVFLLGEFHLLALVANVTIHPILLFFMATTVRLPGPRNAERIVDEVRKLIAGDSALPTIVMRRSRSYGAVTWTMFALVYTVLFLLLFWGLFSLLDWLQFSLVAMFMFVMFLGLVTFLAVRIRRSISDIRLLPARESALGSVITFLSLPVLEFGRWLALHIRELNIPLIFMDRILEAPFKILIDVVEEWFTFVRERREEIV